MAVKQTPSRFIVGVYKFENSSPVFARYSGITLFIEHVEELKSVHQDQLQYAKYAQAGKDKTWTHLETH